MEKNNPNFNPNLIVKRRGADPNKKALENAAWEYQKSNERLDRESRKTFVNTLITIAVLAVLGGSFYFYWFFVKDKVYDNYVYRYSIRYPASWNSGDIKGGMVFFKKPTTLEELKNETIDLKQHCFFNLKTSKNAKENSIGSMVKNYEEEKINFSLETIGYNNFVKTFSVMEGKNAIKFEIYSILLNDNSRLEISFFEDSPCRTEILKILENLKIMK